MNDSDDNLIECVTRDLSFTGICLVVDVEIPQSTRCMLKVENRHTGVEYNHMCQLTWCRKKEDGYLIGLHIYEHLCDISEWRSMVVGLLAG
jgi:hypothetical protein